MKNQSAVNNLRFMFEQIHGYLEATMQNVDDVVARYKPGGPPSILGQYAHLVTGEDWFINVKLANRAPVMMTMNPGFASPPPPTGWDEWARTERVDLQALRAYALEVHEATDAYLASADDTILDQPVDLTEVGMGQVNGAAALFLAFSNVALHTGEISAIKGLNGLAGYPVAESVESAVA
jgi:uncharacterized damage-inducible protein DinB